MRTKKLIVFYFVSCILFSLTSCKFSASFNPYNSKIIKSIDSLGYYLDDKGVLYCLWANPDASEYVKYQDKRKCIVADNVKDFGTILWGGYYINNDDELFIWNKYELSLYNCTAKKLQRLRRTFQL